MDYDSNRITENTRASYPIEHIGELRRWPYRCSRVPPPCALEHAYSGCSPAGIGPTGLSFRLSSVHVVC